MWPRTCWTGTIYAGTCAKHALPLPVPILEDDILLLADRRRRTRGVTAGRSSELGWPHVHCENVPAKIYFDARYDTPIHTYGTDVHELQK